MTDFILQRFGLREGNAALMQAFGCDNPDDAAMVIIELTWEALRLVDS